MWYSEETISDWKKLIKRRYKMWSLDESYMARD